jgi:hypothetical protein
MDRVGPRLAGSPELAAAQDWLVDTYTEWGVPVRKEPYGTWEGWRQGTLHVDMVSPRTQTLEAELLAWSPGTNGPVEAEVVLPPDDLSEATVDDWLATIGGKLVMTSPPEAMCRAHQELEANARPETVQRLSMQRAAVYKDWESRMDAVGTRWTRDVVLDRAGVAGIITSRWSEGCGVNKISSTRSRRAVGIDVGCEDYGLMYRLLTHGEAVRLRIDAEAEHLGAVPQFNVIAELRGTKLPNEYVLLGAHLDSWHAGTGATDNGTGSITMLEAMRILSIAYPRPRRTILVGHWGAEEMGLIGSRSFAEDHPDIVEGLQVAFNQDNGTWRFEKIDGQGMLNAAEHIPKWTSRLPTTVTDHIELELPGPQDNRGSDHTSFLCSGAPSFRLQSPYDEYRQYTWHTNRDTYDKIVFDDLSENATVAAMLAYRASEDPVRFGRERAILPIDPQTNEPREWIKCRPAARRPEQAISRMNVLLSMMTGSFSSARQAASDTSFLDIRLQMVEIWKDRTDGPWLYVEQAAAESLDRPYRQRVYRLVDRGSGTYESVVYEIPDAMRFAGHWRRSEPLKEMEPEGLKIREGCSVRLQWTDEEQFEGSTEAKHCASSLRGASYATSVVKVSDDGILTWDRGFDASGRQVWGSRSGGYIFERVRRPD